MIPAIKAVNISKKYKIGKKEKYLTLRDSLMSVFKNPRGLISDGNTETGEFWALKDVDFQIEPGEVLGIIGPNGAGKSTLLKILSRITFPTTGQVNIRGRVSSLLEIGTGFNQELTGRENIFLNGAILGMSQKEIKKKFDSIVDFSGVERFLDTPVKHYSSGMYMRLAFSVAAQLESEILLIDEVLAVGDAEFQKKCISKIESITKDEGRTALFVSHNLISVQRLCKKTILFDKGQIRQIGATPEIIDTYLNDRAENKPPVAQDLILQRQDNAGNIRFTSVKISNSQGDGVLSSNDKLKIVLNYVSDYKRKIFDARIVVDVTSQRSGQKVLNFDSNVTALTWKNGLTPSGALICETDKINLAEGQYFIDIFFHIQGTRVDFVNNAATFEVKSEIKSYNFKAFPDNTICDNVIKFAYKNEK